jgi:mannose-1-phosphate guanylyltransferase
MKGIILAAGNGGRLRPITLETPKVLLEVGGWPLIHYPITAMRMGGVTEITVVVGHNAGKVEKFLANLYPEILFQYNENHVGGNALSIGVVRDFVEDDSFVVCMGDHPISNRIVGNLLSNSRDGNTLCIDSKATQSEQLNDATRVFVDDDGYIVRIGKGLEIWNAIDIGVFKMTPEVFSVIDLLISRQGVKVGISDVVRHMGVNGRPFATCDVEGEFWSDVDTLEDYLAIISRYGLQGTEAG